MPLRQRITRMFIALITFMMALALLIRAGLPNRADYTGRLLEGIGYVAPEVGAFAPPFTATTLEGTPFELGYATGKTTLLNFWATWCEPCKIEMPLLQTIHEECAGNVQVVGVNAGENPIGVNDWLKTNGITFAILMDENHQQHMLYRVPGLPSTFVISPTGRIAAVFYGAVSETALRAALENCTAD